MRQDFDRFSPLSGKTEKGRTSVVKDTTEVVESGKNMFGSCKRLTCFVVRIAGLADVHSQCAESWKSNFFFRLCSAGLKFSVDTVFGTAWVTNTFCMR